MSSLKVEDEHKLLLDKLLSDSGLECQRSTPGSLETILTSEDNEDQGSIQGEEENLKADVIEEEKEKYLEEEIQEDIPAIFPTPSLRKVLPERVREIEGYNRIHVLPEEFRTDIDSAAIPKIEVTTQQKCIDILGEITGCTKYKSSLAEFWILDTLVNLLRRAQNDGMDRSSQAVLILWFCEWMKEMQHFDAADRQRMLKQFELNMLSAAKFIAETDHLPTPLEAGVCYKARETDTPSPTAPGSTHLVTFEGAAYECSLRDLTNILHYIFDLFSTDYQYELVRSVFTSTPEYKLIDCPYTIRNPKRLFTPLKPLQKRDKSPKKEKSIAKGKKKDFDTEEYLALLELRAKDEREQDEQEEKEREDWNRRAHILPLSFAADEDFFNRYWPTPPPPVEFEPEPEVKGKAKGKGKK